MHHPLPKEVSPPTQHIEPDSSTVIQTLSCEHHLASVTTCLRHIQIFTASVSNDLNASLGPTVRQEFVRFLTPGESLPDEVGARDKEFQNYANQGKTSRIL
jgi:hypothetical protein